MSDVTLALQKIVRARLVSSPAVTALVPATAILDRHARPALTPIIVLGEAQAIDEGTSIARTMTRVVLTLHVWKTEISLEGVKTITAAIVRALHGRLRSDDPDFHVVDSRVSDTRFLRDPDGETSHAVVTVAALVHEGWAV